MKGQSLIESVLALALISIVLSSIGGVIVTSLSNANFGKTQAAATQYAQEGIETLRQIRNRNYAEFSTYNNNYCLGKGITTLGTPSATCPTPNIDGIFIRSIKIENSTSPPPGRCAVNISRATVTVSWTDGKCQNGTYCHKSILTSCLSTVNPIQAP